MSKPIRRLLVNSLIGLSLLLQVALCCAQEGSFDPSFGDGGRLVVDISSEGQYNRAIRLVSRADGKFLMSAFCYYTDSQNILHNTFCVTQLLADGTYDGNFGPAGAGYAQFNHFATWPGNVSGLVDTIVLQDGRIALLGYSEDPANASVNRMLLVVLQADGSALDTTVGGGTGYLSIKFGGMSSTPQSLVQQPDGKLLVGGSVIGVNGNYDFAVTRILANLGGLDTAFASGGSQIVAFDLGGPAGSDRDICNAVRLQSDGKIVLAGSATDTPADYMTYTNEVALVRLNTDGTRDLTFGSAGDGRVHYATSVANSQIFDALIDTNNRIVLAGGVGLTTNQWVIDRLTRDGAVDVTFNLGNPQIFNPPPGSNGVATRLALTNDGIFAIGSTQRSSSTQAAYFAVTRLDSNGAFDTRFGNTGRVYGSFTATGDVDTTGTDIGVTRSGLMFLARRPSCSVLPTCPSLALVGCSTTRFLPTTSA